LLLNYSRAFSATLVTLEPRARQGLLVPLVTQVLAKLVSQVMMAWTVLREQQVPMEIRALLVPRV